MQQIFVTANDTGVGKTWVAAQMVRTFREQGLEVGYVKVLETGVFPEDSGDADFVKAGNPGVPCETLVRFSEPLAPLVAARLAGRTLDLAQLLEKLVGLDDVDVRIIEGAGGIAVPLDERGYDWLDFAKAAGVDSIVAVVEDRLGAINQARLLEKYLLGCGISFELHLNSAGEVDAAVHSANYKWIESRKAETGNCGLAHGEKSRERISVALAGRRATGMLRELREHDPALGELNLANNDYLGLAHHPKVVAAARQSLDKWGCSASASPLVTGWLPVHRELEETVCQWHDFPSGLVWTSGFQANRAILGLLPQKGDLILADRLIHRSMIAGILESRAQFRRYRHLDLDHLGDLLERKSARFDRVFVVTESVFSMDGDAPDLQRMSELKTQHGFIWMVDEAHALGWYGSNGSGLVESAGAGDCVDILVGTLGKALGSQGAYTLFRDEGFREYLINYSEDFVYSTYMAPAAARAAIVAVQEVCGLGPVRSNWLAGSRLFRKILGGYELPIPDGDSPIVPVLLGDEKLTLKAYQNLKAEGILTGYIRPPTVPRDTCRLRISLKVDLDFEKLAGQMGSILAKM
jgi:8-amino-7-oxononanoate synthase